MPKPKTTTGAPPVQVDCIVQRIRYKGKAGWSVLEVKVGPDLLAAVGFAEHLHEGDRCVLTGEYVTDPKWGRQMRFSEAMPAERSGVEAFLDLMPGIGATRAKQIREKFGDRIWEVIEKDVLALCDIAGITPDRAVEIRAEYVKRRGDRDLLVYARGLGVSAYHVALAKMRFGNDTLAVIKGQPYRLTECDGIGFLTADRVARRAGVPADSPERSRAAVRFVLAEIESSGGSTLVDGAMMMAALRGFEHGPGGREPPVRVDPPISEELAYATVSVMRREGELVVEADRIQLASTREVETEIASALHALITRRPEQPPPAPRSDGDEGREPFHDNPFRGGGRAFEDDDDGHYDFIPGSVPPEDF